MSMFDKAAWQDDRMTLDGWLFRIEHKRSDEWDAGSEHFRFYKLKGLIDEYQKVFERLRFSAPANIVELGMWDGGSLVFWFEIFEPKKIIGLDIKERADSDYFRRYVAARGAGDRIKTYWNTNQADDQRLRQIVGAELDGPIDLVFDDASHLYAPTKRSFETLFPLVRPGGLYIIEDWAWDHWRHVTAPPEWMRERPLTPLVVELIESAGTATGAIASVTTHSTFTVVERGALPLGRDFRLDDHIFRHGKAPLPKRLLNYALWGPHRAALHRIKKQIVGR